MLPPVPAAQARARVRTVQSALAGLGGLLVILLLPPVPEALRQAASGLGLVAAGLAATASGARRAVGAPSDDRLSWRILTAAGALLLVSNAWVAVSGADPVTSPSLFSTASIAVALVMSTVALLLFPGERRRGRELLVMLLDGLIAGGAFLLIASVLVYSRLLDSSNDVTDVNSAFALVFPVLDVVLATVAVLLVVRAQVRDRTKLILVAVAFLLYATADLAYAVHTAEGTFESGSVLDLGWILGYLTLAAAAWTPTAEPGADRTWLSARVVDNLGTVLVFSAFAVATLVQVLFWDRGDLQDAQSALWVVVVVATGLRQLILAADNASLRRGLERRVAEQTADLRRLARHNEVLITSVGDGVYGVDHTGRISFVNPSAAELLGYRAADLQGRHAHETFHAPAEDGSPYPWPRCYVYEAIASGVVSTSEEDEYVRADGTRFPVEITASPLVDGSHRGSQVQGAVITFRDVTQRREVDRLKDEFISVVSHELRTPLTSIRGSLGLLASGRLGSLPGRASSLVEVALKSTERLTRLINDLLDIERIQSGNRPMDSVPLQASELLETARQQILGMTTSTGVRVEVVEASGRVLADGDQVIQTLLNLIGNAVKFSEPGGSVRLAARPDGDQVVFSVSDDGRGIPPDKLESVFERFAQVDSSDTRRKGGTGLGLAISRGIVERHGGRIWAESEMGVGTVVRFTLPTAASSTLSSTRSAIPTGERTEPGASTVLVCDDDAVVVDQFALMLREHGYRVVVATTGEDAVRLALEERPQAVLLDLMMPGTTGAQVLAALRARDITHDVPVVVRDSARPVRAGGVSGLGQETDASVAEATQDWLIKPVSETRLVQAISLAIARQPHPATVLLVEDDDSLSDVIVALLEDDGLRVVRVATAAEAVRLGGADPPDALVLDLRLPDADGAEVVTAFRRHLATARIPLVVYTSAEVEDTRAEALTLGPTVFLTKGRSSPEELRGHVLGLVAALTAVTGP